MSPAPWTRKCWTLGRYFWKYRPKNTQSDISWTKFCVFLDHNIGPESSISESKVQAQGPAIPECQNFAPILHTPMTRQVCSMISWNYTRMLEPPIMPNWWIVQMIKIPVDNAFVIRQGKHVLSIRGIRFAWFSIVSTLRPPIGVCRALHQECCCFTVWRPIIIWLPPWQDYWQGHQGGGVHNSFQYTLE